MFDLQQLETKHGLLELLRRGTEAKALRSVPGSFKGLGLRVSGSFKGSFK